MKPFPKALLAFLSAVLLIASLVLLVNKCGDKEEVSKPDAYTAEIDTLFQKNALIDSLRAVFRKTQDSTAQAHKAELAKTKAAYPAIVYRDREAEEAYRAAPSIERCDTALAAKNTRIASLEHQDSVSTRLIATHERTIAFQDSTLVQKNGIIQKQDALTRRLITDYEKALKPKRFAVVVGPGVHVGKSVGVGAQVTVGWKLTQF